MQRLVNYLVLTGIIFSSMISLCACNQVEEVQLSMNDDNSSNIEIYTDTDLIYVQFPNLPRTDDIQWSYTVDAGIGLDKKSLDLFAQYDSAEQISSVFDAYVISEDNEEIYPPFYPDYISEDETWCKVQDAGGYLQAGVVTSEQMSTSVYINSDHTIIYLSAIGD